MAAVAWPSLGLGLRVRISSRGGGSIDLVLVGYSGYSDCSGYSGYNGYSGYSGYSSRGGESIDLVDEDDGGPPLVGRVEEGAHELLRLPDPPGARGRGC